MFHEIRDALENAPPFMVAAAIATRGQWATQRMVEAVLIAVLSSVGTGFMGYYVALPVLRAELENVRADVRRIAIEVSETRTDVANLRERAAGAAARIEELQKARK